MLIAGCHDAPRPFAEDTGLYSIYGYLTLSDERHHVRIKNLNHLVLDDSPEVRDATVIRTDVQTGATETLPGAIVIFDGLRTHNFRAEMDLPLEETYEVSV